MFVLGSSKDLHSLRGCWRADESGDQDCVYKAFCHQMFLPKEPQHSRTTDTLHPRVAILEPSIVTAQADMNQQAKAAAQVVHPTGALRRNRVHLCPKRRAWKPVKPTAPTEFMERAMGSELFPTPFPGGPLDLAGLARFANRDQWSAG